jgi:hypothetical protein
VSPGSTQTSVAGVFAGRRRRRLQWRQAVTAAGTGAWPRWKPSAHLEATALSACRSRTASRRSAS